MAKAKTTFICESCGAASPKWQGQCTECGAWNTLVQAAARESVRPGEAGESVASRLSQLAGDDEPRIEVGLVELDRVLGGGLVAGSVVLLGGDPGIGKSTLLLQACARLAPRLPVLYVTGEESLPRKPRPSNGPCTVRPGAPDGTSHSVLSPSASRGRDDHT